MPPLTIALTLALALALALALPLALPLALALTLTRRAQAQPADAERVAAARRPRAHRRLGVSNAEALCRYQGAALRER